jgi:hypothetical protein
MFGRKYNEIEKRLLEHYSQSYPRKEVKAILDKAIKQAGRNTTPANIGDILVGKQETGKDAAKDYLRGALQKQLDKARQEGARDEDIQWWYNLSSVEREMIIMMEDIERYALYRKCRVDEGLSSDESVKKVRKYNPMYGDPSDTTHTKGKDRPLPAELKNRIDNYIEKKSVTDREVYKKAIEESSTLNALIRTEIKKGNI